MKILSVIYEYPPIGGGGGAVAAALNETLVAYGHEVRVVTSAMPGLAREEALRGVTIHRTPCWRRHRHFTTSPELLTTLWPAYRKAVELIEQERPDVIHTHFVIPSGVIAYLLHRRFGIPYVLTAHGSDIPGYNPDRFGILHCLLKPLWRRIVRGAAALTSPSTFLADLIRRSEELPVRIIPNGYFPEARIGLEKKNMILVVSRMFPRKGVQHFIDSVRDLSTRWEIVIAGDGPYLETLKRKAKEGRCPIRFTGFLDKNTLRDLYAQARILVFPSIRENFPVVLLEAMDSQCAIITTDAEGCAEVVGDAGIVVKKGVAADIRRELEKLMADPARCTKLGRRGWARVRSVRWRKVATYYVDAFAEAIAAAPRDSRVETPTQRVVPALAHESFGDGFPDLPRRRA